MEEFDPTDPEDQDPAYGDDVEPRDADGSDALEADILRADRPFGADRWGTTAREAAAGEGLDRALARERPDEPSTDEAMELADDGAIDTEDELAGAAAIVRDEFAPPEDVAVSIAEEAPGATDHPEPRVDKDLDAVEEYLDGEP
jgi:hypothetical protein